MMRTLYNWLDETTLLQRVLVMVLAAGLIVINMWSWVLEPRVAQIGERHQAISRLDHDILLATRKLDGLPRLRQSLSQLETLVAGRESLLMEEARLDRVLGPLAQAANWYDVSLTFWKPGQTKDDTALRFQTTPIRVQAIGTFHQLASFLDALGHEPSSWFVQGFELHHQREQSAESAETRIEASITIMALSKPARNEVSGQRTDAS